MLNMTEHEAQAQSLTVFPDTSRQPAISILRRDMPSYVHLFGDRKGLFIPLGEALSILSKIVSRTLKPQAYFIALHLTAVKQDRDEERTAAKVH